MRTRSLETLRRDAATTCKWRGHSMRWGKPFEKSSHGHAQQGDCCKCGAWVQVQDYCSANEIDIGGPAIGRECRTLDGVLVRYGKNTLQKMPSGYMATSSEGLTDWPILQVEPVAPGFERFALWDHPSWFPLRFRRMVSKYMLKHEKE